jgi:hypothetical protein
MLDENRNCQCDLPGSLFEVFTRADVELAEAIIVSDTTYVKIALDLA